MNEEITAYLEHFYGPKKYNSDPSCGPLKPDCIGIDCGLNNIKKVNSYMTTSDKAAELEKNRKEALAALSGIGKGKQVENKKVI